MTRWRVSGEMDLATGELLRTMETVAGERSRYSARILSVTGLPASGMLFFLGAILLQMRLFR